METPIKIVYYKEVIDNWGRTESSSKGEEIKKALENTEDWTDDMTFEDEAGNLYFVDYLAGKEVEIPGIGTITVPEDPDKE